MSTMSAMGHGRGRWKRGECKLPGGKLIAASVLLDDGDDDVQCGGGRGRRIAACRIDGDFFIGGDEPSHALIEDIETAIVASGGCVSGVSAADGTSPDAVYRRLVATVRSVLQSHPSSRLIGADAVTIAVAVCRAVGEPVAPAMATPLAANATADADFASRWAVLHPLVIRDEPREPAVQMGLEQAIGEAVANGEMPAAIRFWQWDRSAVVIGRFQSLRAEVNGDQARAEGITGVRRITGGGAMFAEPRSVITYSLYAPLDFVKGLGVEDSYRLCDLWVMRALRELGIEASYRPINDIASPLGKIGGAAQRRMPRGARGAVLHHTMLSYDIDAMKMTRVLNISKEKMSDKAVRSAVKHVDPLRSQTGLSREAILDHLARHLVRRVPGASFASLDERVLDRAGALADARYRRDEWTGVIA